MDRRQFLWCAGLIAAGASLTKGRAAENPGAPRLAITQTILWNGRKTGRTWFHPRACVAPDANGKTTVFMTLQEISGSDLFGTVHWTQSTDQGKTWREPEPIAAFERKKVSATLEEGVCDVVPQYHPATGTVLAMGHNVYYQGNKLAKPAEDRFPVYAILDREKKWTERRRLEWNDPRGSAIYTSNCGQRWILDNGDILVPLSFGPKGRTWRSVTSLLCSYDGRELKVMKTGNELVNKVNRGLLEPSLVRYESAFFMTIRAEDNRGYVTQSQDGLNWDTMKPWCFDDGEALTLSTTQQHWLVHRNQLWLAYTRKTTENQKVMRWRAPLFIAAVNVKTMRLVRSTEQVVFPMQGDPVGNPEGVARMGNFHPVSVTPEESWITVGEEHSANQWKGDTLLARIR